MTTLPGTLADTELHELIRIIKETQGFDFSNYSKASLKRRLSRIITLKKLGFQDLKEVLINNFCIELLYGGTTHPTAGCPQRMVMVWPRDTE